MRITRSTELQLPGVRILHFERLVDKRGYFTEHYSKDEVAQALACAVGESFDVKQVLPNRLPQMLVLFVWLRNTSGTPGPFTKRWRGPFRQMRASRAQMSCADCTCSGHRTWESSLGL